MEHHDAKSKMERQTFYYLIERYLKADLTEEESAQLLDILKKFSSAADILQDNLWVDTMLQELTICEKLGLQPNGNVSDEANDPSARFLQTLYSDLVSTSKPSVDVSSRVNRHPTSSKRQKKVRRRFLKYTWPTMFVASLSSFFLILLILLILISGKNDRPQFSHVDAPVNVKPSPELSSPSIPAETTSSAVAIVSKLANVVWAEETPTYDAGSIISPGWLRLKSGLLRVQFFSGTSVVIEGPAEFMVVDSNRAHCLSGNVVVDVPKPATGFMINVPQMSVIDRGTSFSLEVSRDASEVHVLKGMVDLDRLPTGMEQLLEGEAARVTSDGTVKRFRTDMKELRLKDEIQLASMINLAEQLKLWNEIGKKINNDPTTLVHFDMEFFSENDDRLLNNAEEGKKSIGDGIIVGCRKGIGHLPGKGALEFRQISDRVWIHVPQVLNSSTFMMRLRVDGLFNTCHSLLMSEGESIGGVNWMICSENSPAGQYYLRFSIVDENGTMVHYDTPVFFSPENLGRWMELTAVIDAENQSVSQYIDGKKLNSVPLRHKTMLRIGRAELGNGNASSRSVYPVRNFSGCIDDFIIYSRSIKETELQETHSTYHER